LTCIKAAQEKIQTRPGNGYSPPRTCVKAAQEKVTVRPGKGTNPPRKWLQSAQDMYKSRSGKGINPPRKRSIKSRSGKGTNPPRKCKSCRKVKNGVPYYAVTSCRRVAVFLLNQLPLSETLE